MNGGLRQIDYPEPAEIAEFAAAHGLEPEDVLRDIVRLVAIHEMVVEKKFLNEDCVLCGGMALRLYGSPRYTAFDTDTSYRLPGSFDAIELQQALEISVEDLTMDANATERWEHRKQLTIAQPVQFRESFAGFDFSEQITRFSFTVARRGLLGPARWLPLTHPYPDMGIEGVDVPVMDLTEQASEKLIGWCAHGLAKHYIDAAWIFEHGPEPIDAENLIKWTDKKLESAHKRDSAAYADLRTRVDMVVPLLKPDEHTPPLGDGDKKLGDLRQTDRATAVRWSEAKRVMKDDVLPILLRDQPRLKS